MPVQWQKFINFGDLAQNRSQFAEHGAARTNGI